MCRRTDPALCWGTAGSRVLARAHAQERVGVFARRNNRLEVVEYSELDPGDASASDPGEYIHGACLHFQTAAEIGMNACTCVSISCQIKFRCGALDC